MKKSFYALAIMFALIFNALTAAAFGDAKNSKALPNQLAAQLPASDAIVNLDLQRLMNVALPQLLAGNMQSLDEINAKIDKFKNQTGIDARQFEQIAVGIAFKQISPTEMDFEPVFLARGKFDAGALLAVAKLAAKGKYREEKLGAKTVFVFSLKEILQDNKPPINDPKHADIFNKILSRIPAELAVTTFDDNTLAFGTMARVSQTIAGKSRANQNVLSLVNRKPNAIMSFAANLPANSAQFFKLDNDEIGKNINAVRQVFGSMDVADGKSLLSIAAKTYKPEQAKDLEETLSGLQMLGRGLLGGMKGADKKVYARMAENARITRNIDELMIDVQIPNSDLNILLGKK